MNRSRPAVLAVVAVCLGLASATGAGAAPRVEAEPATLYFPPTDTTHTFVIRNAGDGTLTWTLTADRPWIAVQPAGGSTTTDPSTVRVTVDRAGMAAGSEQTGTITVTTNGGTATVTVRVAVPGQVGWPLPAHTAAHVFDKCIGGYIGSAFHGAIDTPEATGTDVLPMLTGVVRRIQRTSPNGNANDYLRGVIWISPAAATSFSWAIGHVYDIPPGWKSVAADGAANATTIPNLTTVVGKVADWPAASGGIKDHVHVEKVNGTGGFNETIINPLHELRPLPTLTARLDPTLFKRDGSTSTTHDFTTMIDGARVVQGDVDFVAHSTTDVTAGARSENDRAEINAIGHGIQGLGNVAGRDVSERFLLDATVIASNFKDAAKVPLVYDEAHRTATNRLYFNYFIVTNCGRRTDAQIRAANDAIVNVMRNAWQTAVDRGADDDDAMAGPTGTDDARAPNNGRAKYPDGRYRVTVRARTFNPDEEEQEAEVYANNHSQTIVPDKSIYLTGEPVFVTGENYRDDRDYTIYLIRRDAWPDHAPIPHGAVVASVVATSDADGRIPNTLLWPAYAPNGNPDEGYDVVVDYDEDGEYHLPRDGHTIDALNHIVGGGEVDEFEFSLGRVTVESPGGREVVSLMGPTTIHVRIGGDGEATDADGDGLDEVATEVVAMELTGYSAALGRMVVRVRSPFADPHRRSIGEIEETRDVEAGRLDLAPFCDAGREPDCAGTVARSYFDVYFEVETRRGVLHGRQPKHMESVIRHKPPREDEYQEVAEIELFDEDDRSSGFKITASHHVPEPGETVVRVFELIETLFADDPGARIAAAEALGEIGAAAGDAIGALTLASEDPDPEVGASAAAALERIRGTREEPPREPSTSRPPPERRPRSSDG